MASAVALVVFQSCVCFCLSIHTLQSSTAFWSFMTSSKASIMTACVSIGARYHHQENSKSRQNMPSSSSLTERSLSDFMIAFGVSLSVPKRVRAKAMCPSDWRLPTLSQCLAA